MLQFLRKVIVLTTVIIYVCVHVCVVHAEARGQRQAWSSTVSPIFLRQGLGL